MAKLALSLGGYTVGEGDSGLTVAGFKDASGNSITDFKALTPAIIINTLIPVFFIIAGLVLFAMLIGGGFTIFLSTGNPEKIKQGTGMITNGLVGFLIMFAAYWIIQLVEYSLGVKLI